MLLYGARSHAANDNVTTETARNLFIFIIKSQLSDDDIAKLTSLLMKLKDANIDWDSVINQAQDWASKLGDKINDPGFWEKIGNFFMDLWDKIKSLFS
jgi:uncharacterized protein YpuA (DUF1002 family)